MPVRQVRRRGPQDATPRLDARIDQSLMPLRIGAKFYTLHVCVDRITHVLLSYRLTPAPTPH